MSTRAGVPKSGSAGSNPDKCFHLSMDSIWLNGMSVVTRNSTKASSTWIFFPPPRTCPMVKLTTPRARFALTSAIPAIIAWFFRLGSLSCWASLSVMNEQLAPGSKITLASVEIPPGRVISARQVMSKTCLIRFCGGIYVTLISSPSM